MKFFVKFLKTVIAFLLVPFCLGGFWTIWQVIMGSNMTGAIWVSILAGVIFWVFIFIFLPEPKWLYVLGHELTHAIWSLPFGGKLRKIKVTSGGGHVLTTKSNFLISLAPYFFPFYVVLAIIIFAVGNIFWDWSPYVSIFYFFIGFAYAFHITLTLKILKIEQPDIVKEGYIFSTVVILLGNICVLLIGILILSTKMNVSSSFDLWINNTFWIYHYIGNFF